jgi:hypothetical protein
MVNPNRFYTYAYLRKDRTPYYIGKGSGRRINENKGRPCEKPKDKSRIIFLKQNLTEEEAFQHEKYMIAVFGRKDLGTGILRNKTDGGEGPSGRVPSEETREKMRMASTGRTHTDKARAKMSESHKGENNHNYGKPRTQEVKDKISKSNRGKTRSEEARVKMKEINETNKKNKIGLYSITPEKRKEIDLYCKQNNLGIYALTEEERKELGRKNGKYCKENGLGIFSQTKEDRSKRATQIGYQKWMCTETGYISNAGGLSHYQKARGIDTSKRVRLE